MTTTTKQTLRTHICKHWSRHARWDLRDGSTLILFQCDSPGPSDDEYGRGDIPRSERCLLGWSDKVWKTNPTLGAVQLAVTGDLIQGSLLEKRWLELVKESGAYFTLDWDKKYAAAQQAVEEYDAEQD